MLRYRWLLIAPWVMSGLSLVTAFIAQRHSIPLWAPPVGTTRWVLGSGILRVEHTFAWGAVPRWWLSFNVWAIRSSAWADLHPLPGQAHSVGYADIVFDRLGCLFLAAAVAASLIAIRRRSCQPRGFEVAGRY